MAFKLKLSILLLWTFLLSGCKDSPIIESKSVLITFHEKFDDVVTDSVNIINEIYKDSVNHIFLIDNDTLDICYSTYPKNSAFINMFLEIKCPIVSRKKFVLGGVEYEIKKYYYNLKDSYDEEASYFVCDQYGLLLAYSNGWGKLYFTLTYDEMSKTLCDKIINDPTGFYNEISPALRK